MAEEERFLPGLQALPHALWRTDHSRKEKARGTRSRIQCDPLECVLAVSLSGVTQPHGAKSECY